MKKVLVGILAILIGIVLGALIFNVFLKDKDWKEFLSKANEEAFANVVEVVFNDETSTEELSFNFKGVEAEYFYTGNTLNITGIEKFPKDMSYTFEGMSNLKTVDFGNVSTEAVENIDGMFKNAINLETVDLNSFTNFEGGTSSIDRTIKPSKVFEGCTSLQKVYIDLAIGVDAFKDLENLNEFSLYRPETGDLKEGLANWDFNVISKADPVVIINNSQLVNVNILGNGREIADFSEIKTIAVKGYSYSFELKLKDDYATGYNISVSINGTRYIAKNGIYTVPSVDKDININVTAARIMYAVTVVANDNAVVTAESEVAHGTDFSFTVEAKEGFELVTVAVNGTAVTANEEGNFIVSNVTSNIEISVAVAEIEVEEPTTPDNGGDDTSTDTNGDTTTPDTNVEDDSNVGTVVGIALAITIILVGTIAIILIIRKRKSTSEKEVVESTK